MSELTEEEIEQLEEMSRQIKKEKLETDDKPYENIRQKSVEDLKEEAREKGMMKKPYLERRRDRIDKRKEERDEEKRIHREAYTEAKKEAIKKRAKRKAKEKYSYTTAEKITGSTRRTPSQPKKRRQPQMQYRRKGKTRQRQRQPQMQPRRMINFDDALGSFSQPQQRQSKSKPPDFNMNVDYGSALGGFGSKKKKPIDPFKKLF